MHRWIVALWALLPLPIWAADVAVADFARDGDLAQVQISPDGKYFSEVRVVEGAGYLEILRVQDRKPVNVLRLERDHRVAAYWWASSTRLVISLAEQQGTLAQPRLTGELLGMDAERNDGTVTNLFGYRHVDDRFASTAMYSPDADFRFGTVVRTLPRDGREAIIQINDFSNQQHPDYGEIDRLNVINGRRELVTVGPLRGFTQFLVDPSGNPRYAVSTDEHSRIQAYSKADGADWKLLSGGAGQASRIVPFELSGDGKRVFLLTAEGREPYCLSEQDLASGERRKLSCDPAADASGVLMSFDRTTPIAALYEGAPPWERVLDSPNPDAARLSALQQAFPGQIVMPVSATEDGSRVVLRVYSDRNPGDYYLFDPKTLHADLLASQRDWIDPDEMSEQRAIEFKARDGQSIHGILTLPHGREAKGLPLVVKPHGGPFDVLDTWGWEPETQLLASRGYAVLQVNFRGSGGYGEGFKEAGRQHWDQVMIDDISDGARWAVQQGIADGARLCIYGGSYGGYAALMSAVREPDLYRCAIGYAGVYDLNLLKSDGDVADTSRGRTFFREFIGVDAEHLKAASPLTYIDRLKAAVMIVHGEEDKRAPVSQAKALRKALDARHYPYEWLVKPEEGHGFYLEKNREELYQKMLAFLDRNIGPQAPAKPAPIPPVAAKNP